MQMRPKKEALDVASTWISFRLNKQEGEKLKKIQAKTNIENRTEFIKKQIFSEITNADIYPKFSSELLAQLRRIGININQIAFRINTSELTDKQEFRDDLKEMHEAINSFHEILKLEKEAFMSSF